MHLNHEQIRHAKAFGWNPETTYAVSITDIWISRDVQLSIGRQVKAMCISYGMPYSYLRESMVQQLFWHEESGRLGILIEVQGSSVESVYAEIPDNHWGFRENVDRTQ